LPRSPALNSTLTRALISAWVSETLDMILSAGLGGFDVIRQCLVGLLVSPIAPGSMQDCPPPTSPSPRSARPVPGIRLIIPDHTMGSPMLPTLSLCTCCRHYPGAAAGCMVRSITQPCQPSPKGSSGRPAHRLFLDACSAFTRVTACTLALSFVTCIPPPWLLRLLPAEAVAGWDLPLESAALPRRTPTADIDFVDTAHA
jgi:hypothetical protein